MELGRWELAAGLGMEECRGNWHCDGENYLIATRIYSRAAQNLDISRLPTLQK
jgi:hypothetical protein